MRCRYHLAWHDSWVCGRSDGCGRFYDRKDIGVVLRVALAGRAAARTGSPFAGHVRLSKQLTLTGTVRLFQWTNPHSYIQLVVKPDDGVEQEWSLEMGTNVYLYNLGWRPSTVKAGDTLTVTVVPLRSGAPWPARRSQDGRWQDAGSESMSARRGIARSAPACATFALLCSLMPLAVHAQSLPDWSGYWVGEGLTAEISGFPGRDAKYKMLTPTRRGTSRGWRGYARRRRTKRTKRPMAGVFR